MLTKITLNNFKSFKKEASVDLMKTNYAILSKNVAENGTLKGCIFVGANASGKSTIILGVKLLLDFLFSERNINSGSFLCMFGETPCYSLAYEFLIDGKIIRYSFEVDTKKNMISEKLFVEGEVKMERMGLSAKSYIQNKNGINYDETDVGKDTLFLRTLYFNTKFASNAVLKSWMDYLKKSIYINMFDKQIVTYGGEDVSFNHYLEKNGCDAINDFFNKYNFEQNIEYEQSREGENVFFKRKGFEVSIPFRDESLGNQNLLLMLPSFLAAIKNDGLLLIDEFSSGFHNELENLLVRYFMEKSTRAQMLFVSHSTNLLSNSILRPDQEYAVEFRDKEGSVLKRFSHEQPRSAQNIEKMYVSGVFGGLPEYQKIDNETE